MISLPALRTTSLGCFLVWALGVAGGLQAAVDLTVSPAAVNNTFSGAITATVTRPTFLFTEPVTAASACRFYGVEALP